MKTYVVAARHRWNELVFRETIARWPERWVLVTDPKELSLSFLEGLDPRYIFFPHWSWRVPSDIVSSFECVCFHETDVPFGRGGSPVQNLIAGGFHETRMTALRMTDEIDAGPVYLKRPLSLQGGGEEVFLRSARLAADMMRTIVEKEPAPAVQKGTPSLFERRRPSESVVPPCLDLEQLFDHIRMLDVEGYPHAFVDVGPWRLELRRPALRTGEILADVRITRRSEREEEGDA